jgi:hypothetical protein
MPPKSRPPNRGRRSQPVTLSAPTGGLNGRDAYTDMSPNDAFRLDNWIPNNTSVDTRGGSKDFADGAAGAVESLEVYTGGVGSKMLAFGAGSIYDATNPGAVGTALATGKTSNRVTTAMFANTGNQFLLIFSGADQPLSYDGTTLTGLTITGAGLQDTLHSPMAFKGRVYLAQQGKLGFYYLGLGAIQGAASYFDLAEQSLKGGSLATIASYSQESMGTGPQDYAVFVTTEGEYIMYAGYDPANAANWEIVGRYFGPPPIGRKCWFRFRSDLYFITQEGVLSLTQIRQMGDENSDTQYLTGKLGKLFADQTRYATTHGWCGVIYPRGNALYLNVPLSSGMNGKYTQFVMNTNSNAWCQFKGWDAVSWALFNGRAYFGTYDGRVVLADEGYTDNGAEIRCVARQAWNTFDDQEGMGEYDKHFHGITFAMQADGKPAISCALNVNFEDDAPVFGTAITPPTGAAWDVTAWDSALWAGAAQVQNISVSVGKIGYIASAWMQAVSTAASIRWFASRIILEKTTGMLLQ